MALKALIITLAIITILLISGCTGERPIGGDTDEHGCIGSAGYRWCDSLQECVRTWETPCPGMVTSFRECEMLGYPVMESYPRQCQTPEDETFTEDISNAPEQPITPVTDSPETDTTESLCAEEGGVFSAVFDELPDTCCEGLKEWNSGMDTGISIADDCYETGLLAGSPVGVCINCGDGICEGFENPCNCPEDCIGKDKSDFLSIEDFCQSDDWIQSFSKACEDTIKDFPICGLC